MKKVPKVELEFMHPEDALAIIRKARELYHSFYQGEKAHNFVCHRIGEATLSLKVANSHYYASQLKYIVVQYLLEAHTTVEQYLLEVEGRHVKEYGEEATALRLRLFDELEALFK